ncbi:MAG: hypothetical protein ACRDPC_03690 [Solirubrobacteraceae bacterium]
MNVQEAWDALLAWCSELGCGDLVRWHAACQHLDLAPWPTARTLSMLGHVEIDWDHARFAAAPTTLTTIPGLPGRLLLTGARPYHLISELADVAAASELDVDVHQDLCHQFGRGPSTAFVDADPADAPAFCAAAGIRWSPDAARQIGRLLPAIRVETATIAHRPDDRFPHARVDPHSFRARWDEQDDDRSDGLWLYRTYGGRRRMILRAGHAEPRMVLDADVAPYVMVRPDDADPVVEYRRAHRLLIVNAAAPLPALHARVASLCSGRVPIRRDVAPGVAFEHHVNVDPQTAGRILSSLGVAA